VKPYGSLRTHGAGTLRRDDDDTQVVLAGWVASRRDHGGVVFLDLRDRSGVVQVVADPGGAGGLEAVHDLRAESVVLVRGTVRNRPEGMANPLLATGEVEVAATGLEILSLAAPLPFPLEERSDTDEALRLTYRYLDLRRAPVARAIQMRAATTRVVRRVLEEHGFLDVETPLLTRSTPEGARDFLVPSRLQPGSVYALPQSPQLFKQLLMVAGLERYYQIARCFRDEDLRADRQPEFTQIDIEASFVDEEDIYVLIEELMSALWRDLLDVELALPFPRLTYREALRRFGSDKPDTRYEMELIDCGEVLAVTEVGVFRRVLDGGGAVLALCLQGGADLTRRDFDRWTDWARARGAGGLAWAVVEDDGGSPTLRSPLAKFLSGEETAGLLEVAGAVPGDALFFAAAPRDQAQALLGGLRVALAAERGLLEKAGTTAAWNFLWVTEAPVFEWSTEQGRWDAVHHPFTAPVADWVDRLEEAPGEIPARAYDLVLNGVELGGGSIRIHQPDLQRRVFALLGIGEVEATEKFGFLLRGLSYGAPPHGGIAFGVDRLAMLLAGGTSLRDVIAFPKTQSGGDPLTGAPAPATSGQLAEVGLRALPSPRAGL